MFTCSQLDKMFRNKEESISTTDGLWMIINRWRVTAHTRLACDRALRLPVLRASRSLENGSVFQSTKGILNVVKDLMIDFIFSLSMGFAQRRRRHYAAEHLNHYTETTQLTEAFERKHSKNPQVRTYSFKVWQKGSRILGCYWQFRLSRFLIRY